MSEPERMRTYSSALAAVRVNRGSTTIIFVPVSLACSICSMLTGWASAALEPMYNAHPVSMLHMLHAKENGTKMIVVDPRFTRTAAKADEYIRIRSGSDIPFLFGMLYHIFANGWEDKKYINDRVYGMEEVKKDVMAKWTPEKVEDACGVPEAQMF